METWIEIARGPLFRIALTVMLVGLGYRLAVVIAHVVRAWRRAGDPRLPTVDIVRTTLAWLVPMRLLRQRPAYSVASVVFHLGVVVVPLFLSGHLSLIGRWVPGWWPHMPAVLADGLSLAAVAAALVMLAGRFAVGARRDLTRISDVGLLLLLVTTLLSGFLSGHSALSPMAGRSMVLLHMVAAELVMVLVPLSKIAHCVLYPFTQLVFQLGWHFPADTGRHVARVLAKENEPI